MAARDPIREPEQLERLWLLRSDGTPIERLLAYEPKTGAGHRHRTMLLRRLSRELGLDL